MKQLITAFFSIDVPGLIETAMIAFVVVLTIALPTAAILSHWF